MNALAFVLIVCGGILILSVALNSWENAWHVLTGQAVASGQLFQKTDISNGPGIKKY